MRKIKTMSFALMAGLAVMSSGANAVELQNGVAVTVAACTISSVPILTTNVTVNLSKNVAAGYQCRLADATLGTVNRVVLGTCHSGGTAKARTVTCGRTQTGMQADGVTPIYTYSPSTCTDGNFADPAAPTGMPVTGSAMYTSSTAGGAIGEDGMATTACNGTGISGLVEALPN